MDAFDEAVAKLLPVEGGYTNDPSDSGGETNFGITLAVARAFGFLGNMRDMRREDAIAIYHARYWSALSLSSIGTLSKRLALELFDTAVNLGTARAGTFLQRCLNVLNQRGTLYGDIAVDGNVGPMTFAALREYMLKRGEQGELVLLRALNSLQGAFYIELAEERPKDERYVYGWFLQRVVI